VSVFEFSETGEVMVEDAELVFVSFLLEASVVGLPVEVPVGAEEPGEAVASVDAVGVAGAGLLIVLVFEVSLVAVELSARLQPVNVNARPSDEARNKRVKEDVFIRIRYLQGMCQIKEIAWLLKLNMIRLRKGYCTKQNRAFCSSRLHLLANNEKSAGANVTI
jgi:hypothetical protein